ncbi:MAG: hypothetical protein IT426_18925 [Pirellulales bacterium]|nr:hypothetical protein [Pirellulales bacterium]
MYAANFASAKEPYARFLRALQENGYGDVALEYIDRIEKRGDLPPEVRETLDLERSNSLRAAARNAYDARQAEQLLADAQRHLDLFLKKHPGHPAAASSILMWGDSLFELGQRSLAAARRASDPPQKAKLFAEAREYFKQAGERYAEALKRFLARYEQLTPKASDVDPRPARKTAASAEREEMEIGVVQARFKSSLAKYHLAQTYDDPKNSTRKALLKEAAKGFDDIFQQYRMNAEDERCIVAHLWHGQALLELGDEQTALEVFDEVLGPDSGAADTALAPIYTQATLFRYGLLRKQGKIDELAAEGSKWVESHKDWAKYPYFNGAILELAQAYREQAEKASGDARRKILQKAAILLADAAKIDGPYRAEILLLRRDILKRLGSENVGAAEFLALGDAALGDNNLAEAKKSFEQARQKALDAKDQKTADEARRSLDRVALREAQELFEKQRYGEALQAAEALSRGDATDSNAVNAAELALRSAYYLGATSKNKADAYAQLEKVADFVKNKWPGRPVADAARMILAQSQLQKGDAAAALALFGQVKPESSRYPWALFNIGRIHWFRYLEEKKKETGRDEQSLAEAAAKARESLQLCIEMLQKTLAPGRKLSGSENADPAERRHALELAADARLLLSEIFLESKEHRKAVELLEPLAETSMADAAESSDARIAVFVALIRARLGLEETEKAADHALALLALSPDDAKANAKLASIARLLNEKLKTAEASVAAGQGGDPQKLAAATARRDALKERFRKLIEPLGNRKAHALADLVFLGGVCFNLDLAEEGGRIYQNLLDRAKDDPEFARNSDKALVYARSQLIGVLRSQGKLDEALKQADELAAKYPRALSPKMTRADILEDLSRQDSKKLDDAIAQWAEIRLLLNRENPKRPEYFEVVYKIAKGLYWQYEKSKDKSKLVPAEQLLKTTLVQYANLSGPDEVARYKELLERIQEAKGRGWGIGDRG